MLPYPTQETSSEVVRPNLCSVQPLRAASHKLAVSRTSAQNRGVEEKVVSRQAWKGNGHRGLPGC